MNLLKWFKSFINRIFPEATPNQSQKMSDAIDLWLRIYSNNAPWKRDCNNHSLKWGGAVAGEFARLAFVEFETEITGNNARAEYLNDVYKRFLSSLIKKIELGLALGGLLLKPYISNYKIKYNILSQDKFFPIEFDDDQMTGVVCFSRFNKGKFFYTRLEIQRFNAAARSQTIESKAFVSTSPSTLGQQINLADVDCWAEIEPLETINNIDEPLFVYWGVPTSNKTDIDSPLGESVFANAIEQLKEADEQWDRFLWEFRASELAIDASEDLLRVRNNVKEIDGEEIVVPAYSLPKTSKRLFRKLNANDKDFYNVFNPEIREKSLISGLDEIARKVEFLCSLGYGTISNPQSVEKTAEEVRASKQRSYSAVCNMQTSLETAIRHFIRSIDVLATVGNFVISGKYDVSYNWGDGVMEDVTAETQVKLQEVSQNIRTPESYLQWRYKATKEQIAEMIPNQAQVYKDFYEE